MDGWVGGWTDGEAEAELSPWAFLYSHPEGLRVTLILVFLFSFFLFFLFSFGMKTL